MNESLLLGLVVGVLVGAATGAGLKEAKEFVEAVQHRAAPRA